MSGAPFLFELGAGGRGYGVYAARQNMTVVE